MIARIQCQRMVLQAADVRPIFVALGVQFQRRHAETLLLLADIAVGREHVLALAVGPTPMTSKQALFRVQSPVLGRNNLLEMCNLQESVL